MTKPYHLTQEQALEIIWPILFKHFANARPDDTTILTNNLIVEAFAKEVASAALDKVLGEPVYQIHNHIDDVWWDAPKDMFDSEKTSNKRKLYAPKELK